MFRIDRDTARVLAAVMSWPVILVTAWLGSYLGTAGTAVGAFLGMGVYFFGIFKALPKETPKAGKDEKPGKDEPGTDEKPGKDEPGKDEKPGKDE